MNVNDDAYHLDERVVLALIAGNRASTGRSYRRRSGQGVRLREQQALLGRAQFDQVIPYHPQAH